MVKPLSSLNLLIACIHIYRSKINVIRYIVALLLGCSQDPKEHFVTLIPQLHVSWLNFWIVHNRVQSRFAFAHQMTMTMFGGALPTKLLIYRSAILYNFSKVI